MPEFNNGSCAERSIVKAIITNTVNWNWWFASKDGTIVDVEPYGYQATREATVATYHCAECIENIRGKKLFDVYEVQTGEHTGAIIPEECLKFNKKVRGVKKNNVNREIYR